MVNNRTETANLLPVHGEQNAWRLSRPTTGFMGMRNKCVNLLGLWSFCYHSITSLDQGCWKTFPAKDQIVNILDNTGDMVFVTTIPHLC